MTANIEKHKRKNLRKDKVTYYIPIAASLQYILMMNCFCGMIDQQKTFSLIPAGTIVRDPHLRESPIRRGQGLNLRRT